MRTERALLPARIASRPLHGKARTASRPWTCPAPAPRHWRAEPQFCRRRWLWSTKVSPGLPQLRGHTQSLTSQPCKKWLSSVGLAWWEMALVRVRFKNQTFVTDEKWLPLWLHLLWKVNRQNPAEKATSPSMVFLTRLNVRMPGRRWLHHAYLFFFSFSAAASNLKSLD